MMNFKDHSTLVVLIVWNQVELEARLVFDVVDQLLLTGKLVELFDCGDALHVLKNSWDLVAPLFIT